MDAVHDRLLSTWPRSTLPFSWGTCINLIYPLSQVHQVSIPIQSFSVSRLETPTGLSFLLHLFSFRCTANSAKMIVPLRENLSYDVSFHLCFCHLCDRPRMLLNGVYMLNLCAATSLSVSGSVPDFPLKCLLSFLVDK